MKKLITLCFVIMSVYAFAVNEWGGIGTTGVNKWGGAGAGLAEGMNRRIQIEMQRRQQQLQEQEQRNEEERNRLMREDIRQREIEAQRQREAQEADYRAHMEREAAAAERREQEATAQRQRDAAEQERRHWDSRCVFCDGGIACNQKAVREGYCLRHHQTILKQQEAEAQAEKERNEKYDAAMRNLKKCAAKYESGRACGNWADPGTPYCYKHQGFDPVHPIQEKAITAEGRAEENDNTTFSRLKMIRKAIENYATCCNKLPESLEQTKFGQYRNRLILVDAWNNKFSYEVIQDAFVVTSMGADGISNTDDDIVITGKFPINSKQKEESK